MRQRHVIDGWYSWQRRVIIALRQRWLIYATETVDICDRDGWYLRQRRVIFATETDNYWSYLTQLHRWYFAQWPVSDIEGVGPLHEPRPRQGHGQAHRQVRHTHLRSIKVKGSHLSRLWKDPPRIGPSLSLLARSWTPTVTAKRYLEAQCYVIAHDMSSSWELRTGYSG